jgi:hypothetical protein
MSMSMPTISITIDNQKILLLDNFSNNINQYMNIIDNSIKNKNNVELSILLIDIESSNFHNYEFEYSLGSINMNIKKWVLNNIIYSINCDKTKTNMKNMFNNLYFLFKDEFDKI